MNYNVIGNGDNLYHIIREISIHNFLNSNKTVNQKVLGLYVKELNCDHVLQKDNKLLICRTIEEPIIEYEEPFGVQ
tara:strand:+ start:171 stop:398 length:228 start_codon:yes stop_codon:yes gene_type:complete